MRSDNMPRPFAPEHSDEPEDLVQRLRLSPIWPQSREAGDLVAEAADEIERLRAEVAGWVDQHGRDSAELARSAAARDEYKRSAEEAKSAIAALRKRMDSGASVWWDADTRCAMLNAGQAIPDTGDYRMVVVGEG